MDCSNFSEQTTAIFALLVAFSTKLNRLFALVRWYSKHVSCTDSLITPSRAPLLVSASTSCFLLTTRYFTGNDNLLLRSHYCRVGSYRCCLVHLWNARLYLDLLHLNFLCKLNLYRVAELAPVAGETSSDVLVAARTSAKLLYLPYL